MEVKTKRIETLQPTFRAENTVSLKFNIYSLYGVDFIKKIKNLIAHDKLSDLSILKITSGDSAQLLSQYQDY